MLFFLLFINFFSYYCILVVGNPSLFLFVHFCLLKYMQTFGNLPIFHFQSSVIQNLAVASCQCQFSRSWSSKIWHPLGQSWLVEIRVHHQCLMQVLIPGSLLLESYALLTQLSGAPADVCLAAKVYEYRYINLQFLEAILNLDLEIESIAIKPNLSF